MSALGLVQRWLGMRLWASAEAETLPVPPLDFDDVVWQRREAKGGGAARAAVLTLTLLASALALLLVTAGASARLQIDDLVDRFLFHPRGESIEMTAAELDRVATGAWWRPFVPGLSGRLREAAAGIRSQLPALQRARLAYESCAVRLGELGPAGRLVHGPEIAGLLRDALLRVDRSWHRGTFSYQTMALPLRPYLQTGRRESPPLRGVVTAVVSQHAIALSVRTRDGREVSRALGPLTPGSRFELPIGDGYTVHAIDLLVRPGSVEVLDQTDFPLLSWRGGAISFPGSRSEARIEFDPQLERLAPAFPSLATAVDQELGS